jgi:hypothetical protein
MEIRAPMMTIETELAMKAYSIEVTPDSPFAKRVIDFMPDAPRLMSLAQSLAPPFEFRHSTLRLLDTINIGA